MWEELNDLKGVLEVDNKVYKTLGKIEFSELNFFDDYLSTSNIMQKNLTQQFDTEFSAFNFKDINITPISDYYENVIERNRQLRVIKPNTRTIYSDDIFINNEIKVKEEVENDVTSLLYHNNSSLLEISLDVPNINQNEMSLITKKDWIDILLSDVDIKGIIKRIFRIV